MKKAVFRGSVLILVVALVICGLCSAYIYGMQQTRQKEEELSRLVRILAAQFDPAQDQNAQANAYAAMLDSVRVTVIAGDGRVTGDSQADYAAMENHLDREEILEARATKAAVSVRHSSTIGKQLMYAVYKTQDGSYLRLAEEYGGPLPGLLSFLPAVAVSALLSLLIAAILTRRFSRGVTGPITALLDSLTGVKGGGVLLQPDTFRYEELRGMADKINALAADISVHIERLQKEKDKIAFILDNMKEGFLLLDDRQTVLLINQSACLYLRCDKTALGQNLVHATQNMVYLQAAEDAISSQSNKSVDIAGEGRVIEAQFTFVDEQRGLGGASVANGAAADCGALIITMADVTENRNAAKVRRDFFSNASHELKTPITSIKGSVELLCAGLPLAVEKRMELLERIGLETERMHSLIDDILMINRIESGEVRGDKEQVDLASVVRERCDEIMPLAGRKNLSVQVDVAPATLYANHKNICEMVGNLLINAVKYNRQDGRVDVTLKNTGQEIILAVRNDGDPIPPQHAHRIFERFYRVNKGRSKTVGGTGLGLSIVKHVVDGLGGAIRLESNDERGTTFTVTIPVLSRHPAR
ncbi:MAG: ATP-binding protein [Oscillospiraceae bacterium]|nr:ATP-binding protein [Oscillospiraceae bacterium]